MKKSLKKFASAFLVMGLLASGFTVYAATSDTGATNVTTDTEYTLEEMLTYAIEDEYLALAEYNLIMETFDIERPFSNLVKAESIHVSLLEPLFEKYNVSIPKEDWESLAVVPASLEDAYTAGIEDEKMNIAMYEAFLSAEIPEDVQSTFQQLMSASEKHLNALERSADGTQGQGLQNSENPNRKGSGGKNRNLSQNICIAE